MERNLIVKATFKANSEKQLNFVIQKVKEAFGKENINYLTPKYFPKNRIFLVDMDIRIPNAALRYTRSPRNNDHQIQ